ncbi:MAG: hypothetical protein ACI9MR_002527 [Myxococcota bacterium]|jgi:hypothetical protein
MKHYGLIGMGLGIALALSGCESDETPGEADSQATVESDTAVESDTGTADDTVVADDTAANDTVADTTPADTTPVDPDAIVLPLVRPAVVQTVSTSIGDWTMKPGRETTRCVVKRLDNADPLWVTQVRSSLNRGSHHMIIYKSTETEERREPFQCDPFVETLSGETFPLMITQVREETLSFPNGIAFKFEPNQMIRLEAHYLNYFEEDITAHGDVFFDAIAAEDVVSEANLLFYGNPDLDIPTGQSFSTPWNYISVLPGTKVFAITGHTHQWGTNVEISMAMSMDDPGQSIYPGEEDYYWDEPPVTYYEPALEFEEGNGFNYRCSYENESGSAVGFGESANKEMCFLWAYYYPSKGYRICINPGSINDQFGNEICCPGHFLCGIISGAL